MSHKKWVRKSLDQFTQQRMISYTEGYLLALGDIQSDLEELAKNASRADLIQGLNDEIEKSRQSARTQLQYWIERGYDQETR